MHAEHFAEQNLWEGTNSHARCVHSSSKLNELTGFNLMI